MGNKRKARFLNRELKMLAKNDRDYIEKLANSLLAIQNTGILEAELEEKNEGNKQNNEIPAFSEQDLKNQ